MKRTQRNITTRIERRTSPAHVKHARLQWPAILLSRLGTTSSGFPYITKNITGEPIEVRSAIHEAELCRIHGVSGKKSGAGHRAKDYLDRFVRKRFPEGKTIECIVGGVSVCRPLECTVADGLIIAGDAARVVDPLTGGGIYNAMFTGDLAAQVASKAIGSGKVNADALMPYDKAWRTSPMGRAIERNYHIKEYLIKLPDEKLNAIIHSARSLDLKDFSTLTLVKELMKRNPKLVAELAVLKASNG